MRWVKNDGIFQCVRDRFGDSKSFFYWKFYGVFFKTIVLFEQKKFYLQYNVFVQVYYTKRVTDK